MIRKEYSPEASPEDEAPLVDDPSVAPPATSSDAESLRRFVASRDGASFERLVRRHERLVMGVCVRVLGNRQAAEDAFQETFLALSRRAASIRDAGSLAGWLHRVAANEALRLRLQSQRRAVREVAAVEAKDVVPVPLPEDRQVFALIDETLGELPDKYRLPLVLRYVEGLSTDTAARQLGHPKGSMSTLIARGLELMRSGLNQKGVAVSGGLLVSALTALNAGGQAVAPALVASVVRAAVPAMAAHLKTMVAALVIAAGAVGTGLLLPDPPIPDLPPAVVAPPLIFEDLAPAAPTSQAPLFSAPPAPPLEEAKVELKEAKIEAAEPPLPELPDLPATASDHARAALKRALERRIEHARPEETSRRETGLDRAEEARKKGVDRAQEALRKARGRSGK